MTTQLTIDLKAVAYCQFYWKNDKGNHRRCKPTYPTVFGQDVRGLMGFPRANMPPESLLEEAKRRHLLDTWHAVCIFQLRNNHSLSFEGKKAQQMKKIYDAHIYGKN